MATGKLCGESLDGSGCLFIGRVQDPLMAAIVIGGSKCVDSGSSYRWMHTVEFTVVYRVYR